MTLCYVWSHAAGFFDHTEPLFSSLQIINIYQINKYMCCILMFKHNTAMLPTLFNDVFELSSMTHKYSTRQNIAYKIPFCRTKCRQLSLAYVRPKNMELSYIRQLSTIFCHFALLKKRQISASAKPVIICCVCIE